MRQKVFCNTVQKNKAVYKVDKEQRHNRHAVLDFDEQIIDKAVLHIDEIWDPEKTPRFI